MDHFNYRDGQLFAEEVAVADIARTHGTPCYIYSRATLERHWHAFDDAFGEQGHLVCYAVKANSNLGLLNLFARLGSGFDIVLPDEARHVMSQVPASSDGAKFVFKNLLQPSPGSCFLDLVRPDEGRQGEATDSAMFFACA